MSEFIYGYAVGAVITAAVAHVGLDPWPFAAGAGFALVLHIAIGAWRGHP